MLKVTAVTPDKEPRDLVLVTARSVIRFHGPAISQEHPMHFDRSHLRAGAVLVSALALGFAGSAAAFDGRINTQSRVHAHSTALRSWYHVPLTSAQLRAEIPVPKPLDSYTGPVRFTRDAFTAGSGALAVDVVQALGHTLAQGEDLQLTDAFVLDGATPSPATRSKLNKLGWSNVTSVTCEGYTDYGPHSFNRDQALGRARAKAVCELLHSLSSSITTKIVTYGSTRPVVVGGPVNTHHPQNRRVVIDITGTATPITTTTTPDVPVVTTPVVNPSPPAVNVPLAPTILSAVAGDDSATLTITPASSDATVTDYDYSIDGGHTWLPLTTSGTTTLTATINGLTNGTSYSVEVRADSSAGHGAASTATSVTPVAPTTVPDAPTITSGDVTVPSSTYVVALDWTAGNDGGLPITSWEYSTDGVTFTPLTGVTESNGVYTATVDSGVEDCGYHIPGYYDYYIEAVNANGAGSASNTYEADFGFDC